MRINNLLFFLFFISALQAKQIEVCESCTIKSIKDAVAIAKNGDEILIKAGLYKEHDIIVNKAVALIGEKGVIIDGEGLGGIFTFESDNFRIKNIKIINVGSSYTVDYAAIKVLKAQKFNNRASLYLIGVHPKYQNKGVTAILFNDLQTMFNKRGITEVETNPELIENTSIQAFWKNYESELHKKRSTFTKDI